MLVLRNGFTVTGESAGASPANFNAEIGRKIARDNAVQKVWPLMGYALKQHLHQVQHQESVREPETFITRLAAERDRTVSDLGKLTTFLDSEASLKIGAEENSDLHAQKEIMTQLAFILSKRYDDLILGA